MTEEQIRQQTQARTDAVRKALDAAPMGLTVVELRKALSGHYMTERAREQFFTKLRKQGTMTLVGKGKSARWFAPQHALTSDDMAARHAKKLQERREKDRACREAAAERYVEKPPVQRWVAAHEAEPLRPAGPSSVFGLA
jgi:hypothetical protein